MNTLIFDMDGTILDTIEDITNAVNYILNKYSLPLRSIEEMKGFVGNGLYKTLERSAPENVDKEFLDSIYEEMVSYYKEHSNIHTRPYDGIIDAIRTLKDSGYKTAVVSNKRHEAVEKLCVDFYEGLFDEVLGDTDGIAKKPAPDMVNLVLSRLNEKNENAIYIGDSDVDIMTAQNSNLAGVFVSWGFRTREFLVNHGAQMIVDTPKELVERLLEMQ